MQRESHSIHRPYHAACSGAEESEPLGEAVLSLIIPTLNEAENVRPLLQRVDRVLAGTPSEIIFADDGSPDGTADVADRLRDAFPQVRVLRRTGEPGLAAAVLDGFRIARGRFLGVMDADLQHDETVLPALVEALETHDLAVGSRYTPKGSTSNWSRMRELQSRIAGSISRRALGLHVQDPLAGFFVLRRSVYESVAACLRPRGWKILLEILATLDDARIAEVPFTFRPRHAGCSKLGHGVVTSWLKQLIGLRRERRARLAAGRILPRPVLREAIA